jgi:hypothetical protein
MFRPSIPLVAVVVAAALPTGFAVSFQAGLRDEAGRFMGGTEMRVLAGHAGKLYAGNGYWEDTQGPEGRQGSQILVLDGPGARWRVDHDFDERLPDGRRRDLAVSALDEVRFATDGNGKPLSQPVSLLIAANWDLAGTAQVFSRDDATGAWTAATLAQDQPIPGFLPQVRSFGRHRDRVTGVDLVFAGQDPRGVFGGVYDPAVSSRIRWRPTPELDLASVPTAGISGKTAICGSAVLPNATVGSMRRSGNRSTSGPTAQSPIGGCCTPTPIPAASPRPGCAA